MTTTFYKGNYKIIVKGKCAYWINPGESLVDKMKLEDQESFIKNLEEAGLKKVEETL